MFVIMKDQHINRKIKFAILYNLHWEKHFVFNKLYFSSAVEEVEAVV